jgi:hypothetical protein
MAMSEGSIMMKFVSKSAAFSVLVIFFSVSAATASASQVQAVPVPQGPNITARPTVVEKFLGQYAKEHPFTPGVAGQSAPPSQSVNGLVPNMPNVRSRILPQSRVCSIPLLKKEVDRSKTYAIQQITPSVVDQAMVIKPAAPACDEPAVNPKQ